MDWKENELLVSAIYRARTAGAKVKWDDKIDGRQFDVTIRFKQGLHEYLTVVECKAEKRKISVEKVEAFVTKSRDVAANQSVMISKSGFQTGAIAVAEKHNVDLFRLEETWKAPERRESDKPTKVWSLLPLFLGLGEKHSLSSWRRVLLMHFLAKNFGGRSIAPLNTPISPMDFG